MPDPTQFAVPSRACIEARVDRFDGTRARPAAEQLAVEEPLEIRIVSGPSGSRATRSISVTMRTPGHDAELALGFLFTEGVLRDVAEVEHMSVGTPELLVGGSRSAHADQSGQIIFECREAPNVVTAELGPKVKLNAGAIQRNFFTTSSCGVCGKASLLALRAVCPPRRSNDFSIDAAILYRLPASLRAAQGIFERTGGLHAAALFDATGALDTLREDVGRHNAVDKIIGAALLADRVPLRDRMLLLSGRASFELVQKAMMAGIPMIAAVGAPSSLAVAVAREFDITLAGFLRDDHFNAYHGSGRIRS